MNRTTTLFYTLLAAIACSGFICSAKVSGPVKFGGYVRSISTDELLTGYTMTVESANGIESVDLDETGKYSFSTPVGADFIITIALDGYRTFISTNRFELSSTTSHEVNENRQYLYNVPLIPDTVISPAVSGKVVDNGTGSSVTTGAYRIVKSGVTSGFDTGLYDDGSTSTGIRWFTQDTPAITGALTDGTFSVDQNTLLPGYTYDIVVFGATGFRDQRSALSLSTASFNKTKYVTVNMVPNTQPSNIPVIIGQSHLGPDGSTSVPQGSTRSLVITFDRDITLNKTSLKGKGTDDLLTITASDNDGDSTTTAGLIADATDTATTYSSNISVSASGNQLTITLAADTSIITTIDTDDDLRLNFNATFTGAVLVKDANSSYDGYTALGALASPAFNTVFMVRGNYP